MPPAWLPALVLLEDYNGDWNLYFEVVYDTFRNDFVGEDISLQGKPVRYRKVPAHDDKECTFWHLISEGAVEEERLPDMRRCERIGWPRAILNNSTDACLKIWTEKRKGENRVHIWCEDADYLVVFVEHKDHMLLLTAFDVTTDAQRRKYEKRWKEFR